MPERWEAFSVNHALPGHRLGIQFPLWRFPSCPARAQRNLSATLKVAPRKGAKESLSMPSFSCARFFALPRSCDCVDIRAMISEQVLLCIGRPRFAGARARAELYAAPRRPATSRAFCACKSDFGIRSMPGPPGAPNLTEGGRSDGPICFRADCGARRPSFAESNVHHRSSVGPPGSLPTSDIA